MPHRTPRTLLVATHTPLDGDPGPGQRLKLPSKMTTKMILGMKI